MGINTFIEWTNSSNAISWTLSLIIKKYIHWLGLFSYIEIFIFKPNLWDIRLICIAFIFKHIGQMPHTYA